MNTLPRRSALCALVLAGLAPAAYVRLAADDQDPVIGHSMTAIEEGRETFRHDTFGDEEFWGGSLRLHEAIEGTTFGGVGPGLSAHMALELGLKVDVDALPADVVSEMTQGNIDMNSPATTVALLRMNSVVGVKGFFHGNRLRSVGITCALCHSTVDNSFAPGIGKRQDGFANRDLNVGAIISLAPNLTPFAQLLEVSVSDVLTVLSKWGPGKFDAEL